MKNKKGIVAQTEQMLVIVLALVFGISLFAIAVLLGPLLVGVGTDTSETLQGAFGQIDIDTNNNPNTTAAEVTRQATIPILGTIEMIVYMCLIAFVAGFMIMAYYVRSYPALSFFWLFLVVALVIISMFISNAYQTAAMAGGDIGDFYSDWGTTGFIMEYLPHLVAFIGIMGGIVLFALVNRDPESEVQYL